MRCSVLRDSQPSCSAWLIDLPRQGGVVRGCGCVAARTTCVGARALEQGLDRPGRHNVARVYCQGEDGGPAKVKSRACVRAVCVCVRACVLDGSGSGTSVSPRSFNMCVQWDEPVRHHIRSVQGRVDQKSAMKLRVCPSRVSEMNRTCHSSFPGCWASMVLGSGLCGECTWSRRFVARAASRRARRAAAGLHGG